MVVALGVGNPIGWKRYPWFEATKVGLFKGPTTGNRRGSVIARPHGQP